MKEDIYSKLVRISRLKKQVREAVGEIKGLTNPILTDYNQIPYIYDQCKTILNGEAKIDVRRVFIFCVIYLYCPDRLFGGKAPKRIRAACCQATGVKGVAISLDCSAVLYLYQQEYFNNLVGRVMDVLQESLNL